MTPSHQYRSVHAYRQHCCCLYQHATTTTSQLLGSRNCAADLQLARRATTHVLSCPSSEKNWESIYPVWHSLSPHKKLHKKLGVRLTPSDPQWLRPYNWHSAGSLGWRFPVLKYEHILQTKYTEAILSNVQHSETVTFWNYRNDWLQLKNKFIYCVICYNFRHTFVACCYRKEFASVVSLNKSPQI